MTTTQSTTIDIKSLIEQHAPVRFKRIATTDGGEYAGNCPWCQGSDRFHVWPHSANKPHYWCRKCGAQGDAISFLMNYCNMDFMEAVEELGLDVDDMNYTGVAAPVLSETPGKVWQSAAQDFIHMAKKALQSAEGRPYLSYLLARGLSMEIIDKKNIGYVPIDARTGKWIETSFERWGLTEDMVSPDNWSKGCVRVPDGLLFPCYGPEGKPWKLSMYRPLATILPDLKRGVVMGSKECLLNAELMVWNRDKPIIMTEAYIDALSIEQAAEDIVIATSTDGTSNSRSNRSQARLQYAPFVLLAQDNDDAGQEAAMWWGKTIKNALLCPVPEVKDANEYLVKRGQDEVRRWIIENVAKVIRSMMTGESIPQAQVPTIEPEDKPDVCFLCGGILESYTVHGTPCCAIHYLARQSIEIALDAVTDKVVTRPQVDPLTRFAETVDAIANIFAPCEIHRDPPGYTLAQHVAFLNDKKQREEIAHEVRIRRIQSDNREKRLHPELYMSDKFTE